MDNNKDFTCKLCGKEIYAESPAPPVYALQCPSCGSTNIKRIDEETIECQNCQQVTDWYEAYSQYINHPENRKER